MPLLSPPSPDLRQSQLSYTDAYNSIVSRVRRRGGTGSGGVVIFVGVDVDGLLAARIFASLFRQDDVPYRLVPIGGYSELEAKRDEALASDELHTLILLSLGSLLNLSDYFRLPRGCHLHIIDSHRPWNLDNLFGLDFDVDEDGEGTGEGRVWVWGDGDESKLEGVKKSWEALEYEPSDSETEEESDDDTEIDDDAEENEEDENEDEKSEEGDNGEESERKEKKRRRAGDEKPKKRRRDEDDDRPRRLPRAVRDAHNARVNQYYHAGTHYGMSVAQTVYLLATVLERADNDLLWLAILAVTHQYVSAHIDREQYELHHEVLLDEVVRLNPVATRGIPNPDDRSVTGSEELRFTLLRHWNLYDAMLHSGYVAGVMGIWKERGRKKLLGLLAMMGFSLQQCQQAYAHMDVSVKRGLPDMLRDLPNQLRKINSTRQVDVEILLSELFYPSFTRACGFRLAALSAADAVEGLSALLEAARGIRLEVEIEGGRGGGEWFGGSRMWNVSAGRGVISPEAGPEDKENANRGHVEGVPENTQELKKEQSWHISNFWIAYDACDDVALLGQSLSLAMSLHRAIIRQGSAILDKAIIRPLRTFRFVALREGPDLRIFSHPSTLSRLALWLVDAARERWIKRDEDAGKKSKSLPFVVACLNEEKSTYLVVGVTGALDYGDVRKNKFGLAFQQAAVESGASSKHDMFDTSVVEVAASDLTPFLEALHLRSA